MKKTKTRWPQARSDSGFLMRKCLQLLLVCLSVLSVSSVQAQLKFRIQNYTWPGDNLQFGEGYATDGSGLGQFHNEAVKVGTTYNGDQTIMAMTYNTNNFVPVQTFDALLLRAHNYPSCPLGIFVAGYPNNSVVAGPQIFADYLTVSNFIPSSTTEFESTSSLYEWIPADGFTYSAIDAQSAQWALQKSADYFQTFFNYTMKQGLTAYLKYDEYNMLDYDPQQKAIIVPARVEEGIAAKGNEFYFYPRVSADYIGAEVASIILYQDKFGGDTSVFNNRNVSDDENRIIRQAFQDIMGLCIRRRVDPNPQWKIYELQSSSNTDPSICYFKDPRVNGKADTYLAWNYWHETNDDLHCSNAGVLHKWFYLLVNGGEGTNGLGKKYKVNPLDTNPLKAEIYATSLLFQSIIRDPDFTSATTIPELRDITINNTFKLGFGEVFPNVINAWYAVGVGKNCPDLPDNSPPDWRPAESIPEDYYALSASGPVAPITIDSIRVEDKPNSPSFRMLYLPAHGNMPELSTRKDIMIPYADINGDNIFDDIDYEGFYQSPGDLEASKCGVSVYRAMQQTLKYLGENWGWYGLDGNASMPVYSYVDSYSPPYGFRANEQAFYYEGGPDPQVKPELSLDIIAGDITKAIVVLRAGEAPSKEGLAVRASLGHIMGVIIKNKLKNRPIDQWVWTVGEDVVGPQGKYSLINPKSLGNPDTYQGLNYSIQAAFPERAAGVMDKCFYLLCNGGSGFVDNNQNNGFYALPPMKQAEDIIKHMVTNGVSYGSFADARETMLNFIESNYNNLALRLKLKAIVEEAWYAVGVGDKPEEIFSPEDGETNVAMWPTKLRWNGKFNQQETYEIMVSSDANFADPDKTKILSQSGVDFNQETGTFQGFLNLFVDGAQTIYWKVRTDKIVLDNGEVVSAAEYYKADINLLWSGRRSFTTETYKCFALSPNASGPAYPWPCKFSWKLDKKIDEEAHAESYHILVSETADMQTIDSYLNKDDIDAQNELEKKEWEAPLKIGYHYYFAVRAIGPMHSIESNRTAKGALSDIQLFETSKPTADISSPAEQANVAPYGFDLKVDAQVDGAAGYHFEIVKNGSNWTDGPFAIPASEEPVVTITNELTQLGAVNDGNTYFVHVQPIGPDLPLDNGTIRQFGTPHNSHSFTVSFDALKPKLLSPINGQYIYGTIHPQPSDLTFSWETIPGAGSYKIDVFKNNTLLFNDVVLQPQDATTEYQASAAGFYDDPGASYSWKITTIPPSNLPNMPQVASNKGEFNIDADKPMQIEPGADCAGNCNNLFQQSLIPEIEYKNNGTMVFNWLGEYAPNGYVLLIKNFFDGTVVYTSAPIAKANTGATSHQIPMSTLQSGTYIWKVYPILHDGSYGEGGTFIFKLNADQSNCDVHGSDNLEYISIQADLNVKLVLSSNCTEEHSVNWCEGNNCTDVMTGYTNYEIGEGEDEYGHSTSETGVYTCYFEIVDDGASTNQMQFIEVKILNEPLITFNVYPQDHNNNVGGRYGPFFIKFE